MPVKRGKMVSEAEFRRMWAELPRQQIADRLGVTAQAVSCRARARRLPMRAGGGGKRRKIDPDLLREMWAANIGLAEMAAFFGCTHTAVIRRRKALGLPDRECNRWTAVPVIAFLLARSARESAAALWDAEMVDGDKRRFAA